MQHFSVTPDDFLSDYELLAAFQFRQLKHQFKHDLLENTSQATSTGFTNSGEAKILSRLEFADPSAIIGCRSGLGCRV